MSIKIPEDKPLESLCAEPFQNLEIVPLVMVVGPSGSGKSFVSLAVINTLKKEVINNMACCCCGSDETKSPVFREMKSYFKERITFLSKITEHFIKDVIEIFETKYVKYNYLLMYVDDFSAALDSKNKLDLIQSLVTFRHHNCMTILNCHKLATPTIPAILRNNCNVIIVSPKSQKDLSCLFNDFLERAGITKERFKDCITESNKHSHSFIVYCTANSYMNIYSSDGWL